MTQDAIPPQQWRSFCDQFSRQHHGWRVTLTVVDTRQLDTRPQQIEAASRRLVTDQLFRGITAEPRRQGLELTILVGEGTQHTAHPVGQPLRIEFEQQQGGAHRGLRIDTTSGETLCLAFRSAAAPEELDGLAPSEYL